MIVGKFIVHGQDQFPQFYQVEYRDVGVFIDVSGNPLVGGIERAGSEDMLLNQYKVNRAYSIHRIVIAGGDDAVVCFHGQPSEGILAFHIGEVGRHV